MTHNHTLTIRLNSPLTITATTNRTINPNLPSNINIALNITNCITRTIMLTPNNKTGRTRARNTTLNIAHIIDLNHTTNVTF